MQDKIDALVGYIQKECLWQFHSRTWDREGNINGVLAATADLLSGRQPAMATELDRCYFADAKILASEFASAFPWLKEMDAASRDAVLGGVKAHMMEIAVTKSRNKELNVENY